MLMLYIHKTFNNTPSFAVTSMHLTVKAQLFYFLSIKNKFHKIVFVPTTSL